MIWWSNLGANDSLQEVAEAAGAVPIAVSPDGALVSREAWVEQAQKAARNWDRSKRVKEWRPAMISSKDLSKSCMSNAQHAKVETSNHRPLIGWP